jgi:ribulose 1,5-bisphosphate synthetase/thiazole synthase
MNGRKTVIVPQKEVPVGYEADVVVAGAGCSGLMAALAAARKGARVALVDRMAAPGGNLGPGYFGGATFGMSDLPPAELSGVFGEFYSRMRKAMADMPNVYAVVSHAASRTGIAMCQEAGVKLILSAYASDPLMEGNRVCGLLVETKSGRIAIPAKVVIDATGDADIALRAGVTIRKVVSAEAISTPAQGEQPRDGDNLRNPKYRNWNDGQVYFYLGDAEIARYAKFCEQTKVELTDEQRQWAQKTLRIIWKGWPDPMIPILKDGWESGEFLVEREMRPNVIVALNDWFARGGSRPTIMGGRAGIFGDYDTGDWEDVAMMEAEVRSIIFDGVSYFRKRRVPGFENAFVLCIAPFFGARGGPFIEGEYTLTPLEAYEGAKFDDVCVSNHYSPGMKQEGDWFDWPYRVLLPKGVDGLLVTGRGTSFTRRGHDSSLRARGRMIQLGEVAGLAAAIAVKDGVTPRRLDVRKLQRATLAAGYFLGDEKRLKGLGLR